MDWSSVLKGSNYPTRIGVLIILVFSGLFLSSLVGFFLLEPLFGITIDQALSTGFLNRKALLFLQTATMIFGFILPGWVYAKFDSNTPSKYLALSKVPSLHLWIFATVLYMVSLPLVEYLIQVNEAMSLPDSLKMVEDWMRNKENDLAAITKEFLNFDNPFQYLLIIVIMAVLPAIGEEFIFRGILQRVLGGWFKNVHVGIFVAAFLFSAMHVQFFGFFPRFFLGLLLGYIYLYSGSLLLPIFIHFLNNASAITISYFGSGMGTSDGPAFADSSGIVILSSFLTAMVFYFFVKSAKKKSIKLSTL
ncbi:MAG: membrane protease YdiL (CAAX protease family) [Sphingobacteriales bacterium]|jgi:membrane protease YdiL (CAAX protease family)